MTYLAPYSASLHIGRRYQNSRTFPTLDAAKAWADECAAQYADKRVRVKVAKPREGGPVPVCEFVGGV